MLFDAADFAIIETHPYTSELERKLVAEVRTYREREARVRRVCHEADERLTRYYCEEETEDSDLLDRALSSFGYLIVEIGDIVK